MKVSIVVPCFNAITKIGRCLSSLKRIDFRETDYEVIFIDDCSTDGTYSLLDSECKTQPNWRLLKLDRNSGSPSKPRNIGIAHAKGLYTFFLDCDDEILPGALADLYQLAINTSACIVRSELVAYDGSGHRVMNNLLGWDASLSRKDRCEMIIGQQSTVINSFVLTKLLKDCAILWPEHLRMGEDTVFLCRVLVHAQIIEYLAKPTYIYYRIPSMTPSSTQRYGKRELIDHLEVWQTAQAILSQINLDYYKIRLHIGLRVALESIVFRNRGDIDKITFEKLSHFVSKNFELISTFRFSNRLMTLISLAKNCRFEEFLREARPRLLIAGYDLKFIKSALTDLGSQFDIRCDEWTGHSAHDEAKSQELLEWAEYIWCEWLLGNVEWYSKKKKPSQKLVVRIHRMELDRTHGDLINVDAVDAFIVVSTLYFERVLERFPNIPRAKLRLIPNYVRINDYKDSWDDDRVYTLAMIGILPSRKGLYTALQILAHLRTLDPRFHLKIFGHKPDELGWIAKNPLEMNYFKRCNELISAEKLEKSVEFVGNSNLKSALHEHRVGYVLSVSEADFSQVGSESFHLAIADGFAGGAASLVLHWPGAEFIWPKEVIFDKPDDLVSKILELSMDKVRLQRYTSIGAEFISAEYSAERFNRSVRELWLEVG